ncbi:unnamed protein product, partial [Brenthis ino]
MGTRCVYILYLLVMCRVQAELSDIEKYVLSIAGTTPSTTLVQNNGKTCAINLTTNGVCMKRGECNIDVPKIDPATTFILRESDGDKNNEVSEECGWLQVCCPLEKVVAETHTVKFQKPLGCGYSNPGANVFRETTNSYGYADFGEFPWMIALLQKKNKGQNFNDEYIGGGTLIHPSVVITAAHKVDTVDKPDELKCRAGEWDTTTEDEAYRHQEREVNDIVIHSEFLRAHTHNDVALLILKSPFELNDAPHIAVACLELKLPPPGTICYSMGWGDDFMNGNKYANVLKKIKLQLVAAEKCQNQYRNTRLGRGYTLHRSLTCAGGVAGVDTCIGDGGSPLVCPIAANNKVRFSVVGMVAYGLECGTDNVPGVYVKIPEIYDWVITEMTYKGFNSSTFMY